MQSRNEPISPSKLAGIDWMPRAADTVSHPWKVLRSFGRSIGYRVSEDLEYLHLSSSGSPSEIVVPMSIQDPQWPYLLQKLGYRSFSLGYASREWSSNHLEQTTDAIAKFIASRVIGEQGIAKALINQQKLRALSKTIHARPLLPQRHKALAESLWTRCLDSIDWHSAPEALLEIATRLAIRDYDHLLDLSTIPCDAGLMIAKHHGCSVTMPAKSPLFSRTIRQKIRAEQLASKVVVSKNHSLDMTGTFTKIVCLYPYGLHSHSEYKSFLKALTQRAREGTKLGLAVLCVGSHQAERKDDVYELINISDLRFPTITGIAASLESLGWNVSRIEETAAFDPAISPLSPNARAEPRHALRRQSDFTLTSLKSLVAADVVSSFVVIASR